MKVPVILFFLAFLGQSLRPCLADDWPQWRGPQRNGISSEKIRTSWPATGPVTKWNAQVGTGFSSISISGRKAYAMGNTNGEDTIWCFDALSGTEFWHHSYPAQLSPQWYEGGPGATPTIDRGNVFTISKWGNVFCFDGASGQVNWSRDLRQDGLKPNRWGFAGSPLIWHDLVILNAGEAGTALNRHTGVVVWSNGTNATGYASPTLLRLGKRESVLIFSAKELIALDPETGHELWRQPWKTDWDTNNTDPLTFKDCVFLTSFSHGCGLFAVRKGKPTLVYEGKTLFNNLSPGLLLGEYLYAFNGEAKKDTDFRCLHLPTGRLEWSRKDPSFGSVICARDKLIVLSEKGELIVAKASTEGFSPLARAQVITGTCWTPPALANGFLYVRNARGELRCLDVRP